MRILIFGATGRIGRAIVAEAVSRGHEVTRAVRRLPEPAIETPQPAGEGSRVVLADVLDPAAVATAATGMDAVVSAVGPRSGDADADVVIAAADSLLSGLRGTGVRLLVVGGAGSLLVAPGVQFLDTPEFPDFARGTSLAAQTALEQFRVDDGDVDWVVISPPAFIGDGERSGEYQRGTDYLLRGRAGSSGISRADFAVALLDEIEEPLTHRARMTVAQL